MEGSIPFHSKGVSADDQKYLIRIAQSGKIPKGDPRELANEKTEGPSASPKADPTQNVQNPTVSPQAISKPKFRTGSFFAHKPVKLGQDPGEVQEVAEKASLPGPNEPVDFDLHILPILEERCQSCHNAPYDKNGRTIHPKAGLRLDTYEWVMKGNLDGTVVEAGNPDESYLYEVLTLDEEDDMFMPPKGGPLTTEQIEVFKRWIQDGAKPSGGKRLRQTQVMESAFTTMCFPFWRKDALIAMLPPMLKTVVRFTPKQVSGS